MFKEIFSSFYTELCLIPSFIHWKLKELNSNIFELYFCNFPVAPNFRLKSRREREMAFKIVAVVVGEYFILILS